MLGPKSQLELSWGLDSAKWPQHPENRAACVSERFLFYRSYTLGSAVVLPIWVSVEGVLKVWGDFVFHVPRFCRLELKYRPPPSEMCPRMAFTVVPCVHFHFELLPSCIPAGVLPNELRKEFTNCE